MGQGARREPPAPGDSPLLPYPSPSEMSGQGAVYRGALILFLSLTRAPKGAVLCGQLYGYGISLYYMGNGWGRGVARKGEARVESDT